MNCQELAETWQRRWPRPSETSRKQYAALVRPWGEENAGVELGDYLREEARTYGLKYPSRIPALRAMFNDAMRDHLSPHNPFAALRIAKPRKERYFPSTEEVEDLIRAAQEPLRSRIRFSAYTGLRLGEMLAVRPCDVRYFLAQPRVRVREQINPRGERVPRKGKIKDYWASMPHEAASAMEEALRKSVSDQMPLWPLIRYEAQGEWNALRKRLKLPENFVWHSLRHHAATWFLDQGASFEDVAIQLGHDDGGQQIRDTYGHMSREKALDRLEAVVS